MTPSGPLSSRDRLRISMEPAEPDRVPVFAPNIIDTEAPYDAGLRRYLDDFGFDAFQPLGGITAAPAARHEIAEDVSEDGYGCRFRYMGVGLPYCIHHPLADARTLADVDAHPWPDPEAPGLVAPDAADRARQARAGERLTAIGIGALFHQYDYLRGFERWMMDVRLERKLHAAIADRIHHINVTLTLRLLDEVGPYTDLVTVADDLGTSTMPYMSPADFRALVKPYYADLIGRIKARFPHIRFYLHSHGQIMDLVGDFVECGVDVLNPVLPLDGMDPVRLKAEFGRDLCFHGGVDIEHIVPFGHVDQVRDHARRVLDILAPGGGFWFKLQAISPVIPPANVIAAYDVAREHGAWAD